MRITNNMMMNNTLLSLNRNMKKLDSLYMQMTTLKKIQRPSEDPIIAGRALKFRTKISETQQFQSNVDQATSWMSSTETAIDNIEDIIGKMRDSSVQGANDTLGINEQNVLAEQLAELKKQFINEGNVTYDGGRYLFSGFRTDTKLIFDEETNMNFRITESFTNENIEKIELSGENINLDNIKNMIDNPTSLPQNKTPITAYRIRLSYDNVSLDSGELTNLETAIGLTVTELDSTDTNAYNPPSGEVYLLKDTGELIFNENDISSISNFDINYDKSSFKKGDINPIHYFKCTDLDNITNYTPTTEKIEYEVGINNKIEVNVLGKDIFSPDLMRDIDELVRKVSDIYSAEEMLEDNGQDLTEEERKAISDLIKNSSINVSEEFDRLIGKLDDYLNQISTEKSSLGNRIKRLELINNRLEADELNFKELNNNNEGIDLEEVYTEFSMQQVIYNSALNATSKIIQPTLIDFIK